MDKCKTSSCLRSAVKNGYCLICLKLTAIGKNMLDPKRAARIKDEYSKLLADELDLANKEIESQKELMEDVEDIICEIKSWAQAYPETVFIEPTKEDWKKADEVLKEAGLSLTGMSGSNMRHVIKGVEGIVDRAIAKFEELSK